MDDENNNQDAPPPVDPPIADTQAADTLSKDAVAEIVKSRLARAEKKHEAELAALRAELEKSKAKSAKSTPKKADPGPDPEVAELKAKFEQLEQQRVAESNARAFAETMAAKGIDAELHPLLRPHFDPSDPDKLDAMIATLPKTAAPSTPYQSPGAPAAGNTVDKETNPLHWSRDTVEHLKAKGKLRSAFEEYYQNLNGSRPFRAPNHRKG